MYTFVATKEEILKEKAEQKGHFVTEPLSENKEGYHEPLLHINGVKKVSKEKIELKFVFNITQALKENNQTLVHPNGGNAWGHKFINITNKSCLFEAAKKWYLQNRNFFIKKGSWKTLDLNKRTYERGARLGHVIADYYVVQLQSFDFQVSKEGWEFLPIEKLYIDERLEPKLVYRGCEVPADSLKSGFEDYTESLAQKYNFKLPTMIGENMG